MDWKLELIPVPVSNVDRAKAFYAEKVGFNVDVDTTISEEIRFVQLTPPGSGCSIALGVGQVDSEPGSLQGLQLVVPDISAAHAELVERGVDASEVQEFDVEQGGYRPLAHEPDWNAFIFFKDPDGNGWVVQQRGTRGSPDARSGETLGDVEDEEVVLADPCVRLRSNAATDLRIEPVPI